MIERYAEILFLIAADGRSLRRIAAFCIACPQRRNRRYIRLGVFALRTFFALVESEALANEDLDSSLFGASSGVAQPLMAIASEIAESGNSRNFVTV